MYDVKEHWKDVWTRKKSNEKIKKKLTETI